MSEEFYTMTEVELINQLLKRNIEFDFIDKKIFLENTLYIFEIEEYSIIIIRELKYRFGYETFYKI